MLRLEPLEPAPESSEVARGPALLSLEVGCDWLKLDDSLMTLNISGPKSHGPMLDLVI